MHQRKSTSRSLTVAWLLMGLSISSAGSAACLPGGFGDAIQTALNSTAKTAELCQGAVFYLNTPILVTKNGSRIFTTGYPTSDSQKAKLIVNASFDAPAIQAYTAQNVQIRNLVLDGQAASASDFVCSQALLAIAGNNSLADSVTLKNTRGLSALAAADNAACSGLRLTNNLVLDSGFHVWGSTCTGGHFANGIDYRCSNGYVAGNIIQNATDGAISFYGGTGTIIEYNSITNTTRSAFSGIIAASLFAADFTGSVVRFNEITTDPSQHLHVALAIGTHLWCGTGGNPDCQYGRGVSFRNNTGSGTWGWGISVEGHHNATVLDNNLIMQPWLPINCKRTPFDNYYTVNLAHATGTFQSGYVNRETHWPCLDSTPSGQ